PIVQIGSAIGSSVGQWLKLSDDRVNNLVACGAAAGIAATFNAPIAGVIFALEVILGGRFTVRYFSSVVVASVAASIIGRIAFGNVPAFIIPREFGVNSLWEFALYPLLGVLAALVGVTFTRLLYATEDFFDDRRRIPEWVKPAIGGALLGLLALTYPLVRLTQPITWDRIPHIFNVGYDVIESALASELALGVAVALLILKIAATVLTLGSGGSGGVFAPSLFMGAMLGAAFALGVDRLLPDVVGAAGAYALVGMAAVFAASAHAPITAVLILFELTGDYRIILPLMLTVVVATLVAQRLLHNESIYTLKLSRRGVRLDRGRDRDILQNVLVREVAQRTHIQTASVDMTLSQIADFLSHSHLNGVPVLDREGKLWGVVTMTDVERAMAEERPPNTTVAEIGTTWPHLKVARSDESIGEALARMGSRGLGRMPVVDRNDPYDLLGVIRRQDIIRAYDLALSRRDEMKDRTGRIQQLQQQDETEFVEIYLRAGDPAVGKTLQAIASKLPEDCVLISIERQGRVTIPHGDTIFRVGDHITAYTRHEDAANLFLCLHGP
ncbi:MAG: chloride channel protein, partial [Candidatus Promineifilaceae bacterium]|nr:chloride channel protein [Candidatus Promineifilaceae bacterium]